jgi:hypothetical protein
MAEPDRRDPRRLGENWRGMRMSNRWAGNSDVFMSSPSRWPEPAAPPAAEPVLDAGLPAYERFKRSLSTAWKNPASPKNWDLPLVGSAQQALSSPKAWNKGAGATPAEIEEYRAHAGERAEFASRLRQRWRSNLSHL